MLEESTQEELIMALTNVASVGAAIQRLTNAVEELIKVMKAAVELRRERQIE
jgi:hypothetical protein